MKPCVSCRNSQFVDVPSVNKTYQSITVVPGRKLMAGDATLGTTHLEMAF